MWKQGRMLCSGCFSAWRSELKKKYVSGGFETWSSLQGRDVRCCLWVSKGPGESPALLLHPGEIWPGYGMGLGIAFLAPEVAEGASAFP